MQSKKCPGCGLVNWRDDAHCRRCGYALNGSINTNFNAHDEGDAKPPRRTLLVRLVAIIVMTFGTLFIAYLSLLATSDPISFEQRQIVTRAVRVLEARGFASEARMLDSFVTFRRTDNWWNRYVGHASAYAATNLPFQVVTLYPDFFTVPVDDTERAAILLHEAQHLYGAGEPVACAETWKVKEQLGWTAQAYGGTNLWHNVHELTATYAPESLVADTRSAGDSYVR